MTNLGYSRHFKELKKFSNNKSNKFYQVKIKEIKVSVADVYD